MKFLLPILTLALLSLPATAVTASAPSCSFSNSLIGGSEATCTNPNTARPTIMCVTLDGTTPASNGHGTACTGTSWALSPVAAGGQAYPGYFSINHSLTVKIIAGASGDTDSTVVSYTPSVPAASVLAPSFGWQCGPGNANNCQNTYWPSSPAAPDTFRLWDTKTSWSELVPDSTCLTASSNTCDWSILNDYLTQLYNHPYNSAARFAILTNGWVPCWAAGQPDNCGSGNAPHGTNLIPTDLSASGSPSFNLFMKTFVQYCVPSTTICVKDLVKGYEEWNEWNTGTYWTNCDSSGCATDLYEMWAPAAQIVRANVPNAVLIAPSVTPINSNYLTYFSNWLSAEENAKGRISDVASWHLYLTNLSPPPFSNTPETQWPAVAPGIISAQNQVPGWNAAPFADTETNFHGNNTVVPTYSYACYSPLSPGDYSTLDCEGQVLRWQILHSSNGTASLDWYWGNSTIGHGYPTNDPVYATAYENAQQYMIGGKFTQPAAQLPGSAIWTAPFTEANGTVALWVWQPCSYDSPSCDFGTSYKVLANYTDYRNPADGTITTVTPGNYITVGVMPLLLEQGIAAAPTYNPTAGTYSGPQMITLSTASSGAIICANTTGSPHTNGSTGCQSGSTLVTGPFQVGNTKTKTTTTIYAVAGGTGYNDSSVSSATYVINP